MMHGHVPCSSSNGDPHTKNDIDTTDVSESANILRSGSALDTSAIAKAPRVDTRAPFRTRWLYFTIFIFNACSGRFMSLYYLAEGLDESQIGIVFAVSSVTGQVTSTLVGVLADRLTLTRPAGRHWCLGVCIIVATITFTLQALHIPKVSRFATMLACRIVTTGGINSAGILSDAITLQGLHDRKLFGQERLYGAVSWAIVHILLGVLLDMYGRIVQHIFIILAAVSVIASLIMIGVPPPAAEPSLEKKAPGLAALADQEALCTLLRTYCSSRSIIAFLVYAVALGYGMTIVENLIFLLFKDLGASYFLCGVSVVVTVVFEIPLFSRSKACLEKLGVPGLLSVAGLCYSFRVVGYTLCPGGWWVLLFEPMHGVTIAAWSTASVEFVASMTPPAFTATGQAFLNLVRSGLGSALGSGLGGVIIRFYGESACYRSSAMIVAIGLVVYHVGLRARKESSLEPVGQSDNALDEEEGETPPARYGRTA